MFKEKLHYGLGQFFFIRDRRLFYFVLNNNNENPKPREYKITHTTTNGVELIKDYLDIAASPSYIFICTEKNLITIGRQSVFGELGWFGKLKKEKVFSRHNPSDNDQKVTQVFIGYHNSFLLTKTNKLLASGMNKHGNLGVGSDEQYTDINFRPVKFPKDVEIKQIVGHNMHTLFLTIEGEVYGCGNNSFGQIGGKKEKKYFLPKLIKELSDKKIKKVATGLKHTVFLCENGNVYMLGDSTDGQCGPICAPKITDKIHAKFCQTLTILDFDIEFNKFCYTEPFLINNYMNKRYKTEKTIIKDISAGDTHTILSDSKGCVYLLGACYNDLQSSDKSVISPKFTKKDLQSYQPIRLLSFNTILENKKEYTRRKQVCAFIITKRGFFSCFDKWENPEFKRKIKKRSLPCLVNKLTESLNESREKGNYIDLVVKTTKY